jgi:FkbM family methyltransferase
MAGKLDPSGGRRAALQRAVLKTVPDRWHLPIRYRAMSVLGTMEPEVAHLRTMVRPRGVAIDVGANHGVYSYALARLGLHVEAFEPQPWCGHTLEAWARGRVVVHQAGLSDVEGTLTLHLPVVNGTRFTGYATFGEIEGESEAIEVPVRRLDDFAFSDVSFIKIDVEGHEAQVLRGAQATIEKSKPTLLVEIEERHLSSGSIDEVFDQVLGYGYVGEYLHDGAWRPIETFSVERMQRARVAGDASAPYLNNFLFRPQSSSG